MMKITEDLGNLLGFFEEMRGLAEQQIKRLEKIKGRCRCVPGKAAAGKRSRRTIGKGDE